MTDLAVYYDNADQVIPVTAQFNDAPTVVVITLSDPNGSPSSFTYTAGGTDPTPNVIIKDSSSNFHINLQPFGAPTKPPAGLWTWTWTGVIGSSPGTAEVFTGTFRVFPQGTIGSGMSMWYCSMEELKSRLGITPGDPGFNDDDYEIQLAIQTVTDWVTTYCGRHFYQITEARTFRPRSRWNLEIDDIVTVTSTDLDYDGDGIYEVHWTENTDYQLLRYSHRYNSHDMGLERPRNELQVLMASSGQPNAGGGQWLPWLWPFTRQDRVKITGTWGWPAVPPNVTQASLILAADLFKAKDAPWGVAGIGDLGMVKVQSNPWVVELLRSYINMAKKVGV